MSEESTAYGKTRTKHFKQNHFHSVCLQTIPTPRKAQPQKDLQKSKPKVHAVHEDLKPSSEDLLWVQGSVKLMLSAATEFTQPWKSRTELLKCR